MKPRDPIWRKVDGSRLCDMLDDEGQRCASGQQPQQLALAGYPAGVFCKMHRREMNGVYENARNSCDV